MKADYVPPVSEMQDLISKLRADNYALRTDLRDRFAMAALTGYIAVPDNRTYNPEREDCKGLSLDEWRAKVWDTDAAHLYQIADAMMKAREIKP